MRDYFVTQAFHVEPIHKITANARGKVGADFLHIESHGRDLVVIENDLRLWLVDFGIDVAKLEHMRLHRLQENLFGQLKNTFLTGGGSDDEADREIIGARKSFGHDREHLNTGNGA